MSREMSGKEMCQLLYSNQEWKETREELSKRRRVLAIPVGVLLLAAVGVFIAGRLQRSTEIWKISVILSIVAGSCFLFVGGVWVKPCKLYCKHIEYMLEGKKRSSKGVLKSVAPQPCFHEELSCHELEFLEDGDSEIARKLYYDSYKPLPLNLVGKRVQILSNNNMVASIGEINGNV